MLSNFIFRAGVVSFLLVSGLCAMATELVNSWTNPASGHWEDGSWSLGVLPGSNQTVMITNSGYKAVGIFPSTSSNYFNSMTVSNLSVAASADAFSTLLLNYSGIAAPLRVANACTVGTNGLIENLYGAFEVGFGPFNINAGQYIQEGGTTVATNAVTSLFGGKMNLTNATVTLGPLLLDGGGISSFSTVTQAGGVMSCNLSIRSGSYNLLNGILSGSTSVSGPSVSRFTEYGGTNFGSLALGFSTYLFEDGFGIYSLYDGGVIVSNLDLGPVRYSSGEFDQAGGFVSASSLRLGSDGFRSLPGYGNYSLTNGTLLTGTVNLINGGIDQAGGRHTMSNGLSLSGNFDDYGSDNRQVRYTLWGGALSCPAINMGLFGYFNQSGGTNLVAGNLTFVNTSYVLSGGTLLTSNTVVLHGYFTTSDGDHFTSQFLQSGGQHRISDTLSNFDQYVLSGGSLLASNIVLRGILSVSNGAVISNPGLFDFGGSLQLYGATSESFGRLLLSSDSLIDLEANTHTLSFMDSSPILWSNGATLTITNWNGSTNGGGADRLNFGNSSSGLTQAQIGRIQFVNPIGFAAGRYPAQILTTGEIVPALRPVIISSRSGNNFILTWDSTFALQSATNVLGPFVDVNGATNPYTNLVTQFPMRFFRLRR